MSTDPNWCYENPKDAANLIDRLQKENNTVRDLLARSDIPCVYCGLSKADMSKCVHGFPGCSRADDLDVSNESS